MARRVEYGPPAELAQPPCAAGVAAVDGWAQRARMAVGDGPRAEAVGRCLDLLAGTSRAAQDSEAVLRLQGAAEHGGGAGEAAAEGALAAAASGGEAPIDPVALALWQWCEAARQCHLAAVGPPYVVEAACAEVRRLCRAVRARPLAAYEEAKRRFRSSDLRAAVAEKAEADARLAEESLDDGRVAAARESLVGYGHWMLRSFQSPRHIQIIARALERVESGECRRLIIEVSPRHGKALHVDTPIPTPKGWKRMGDLRVGDEVFSETGAPTTVVGVSETWRDRPLFRVTSDDGCEVLADAAHEWIVRLDRKKDKYERLETQAIHRWTSKYARAARVRCARSLDLPDADLPIDPYVLGVWLGDGHSAGAVITQCDGDREFIRQRLHERGYPTTNHRDPKNFGVSNLHTALRVAGLLNNKHVPKEYLRGSRRQRLDLLQGLIDTDGHVMPTGQVEFCNTNKLLSEGVRELVHSLGRKAFAIEGRATLNGRDCGPKYRIHFYMEGCASLPRKAAGSRDAGSKRRDVYLDFEPCGTGDTVCIEVENPSHLFLCGKSMIPTCNSATTSVLFASWYMGRHPDRDIIAASSSQGLANTFGMQVRDLVTRDEFRRVFPHVYPDGEGMSFFRMETDEEWVGLDGQRGGVRARKGTYQVLGRKTKASGKGANLLLIDDLIDEKEADSDAAMAEARRCVQALRSRLAPDNEGSAIVVINTRYREDDVIGFVESEMAADGPWERVRLPSWTDEPADYDLPDGTVWHRQAGEPLWPERYTAEELLRVRDYLLRTSPRDWWAQHCCLIVPSSGAVVDLGWFQRYSGQLAALRHRAARAVVSVDTSKGASSSAARTSITVWLEVAGPVGPGEDGGAYLVWAWAEPVLAPAQIAKMKEVCARWRPHLMLVEGKSTADAVIPILRADPDWARTPIVEVLPDRDKVQRMNLASPQVRDRQVWLPAKGVDWAPWLPEVEKELTFFPKGRFKDLVDSVSQYLNWRRENPLHGSDRSSEVGAALRQRFGGQWGRGGSGWGRPP